MVHLRHILPHSLYSLPMKVAISEIIFYIWYTRTCSIYKAISCAPQPDQTTVVFQTDAVKLAKQTYPVLLKVIDAVFGSTIIILRYVCVDLELGHFLHSSAQLVPSSLREIAKLIKSSMSIPDNELFLVFIATNST